MNHTGRPEAYLAVGKTKNRLKIYNGKNVFLKDGEEFQIELFNPTNQTVGTKILINGKAISNSLLIIKPGERYHLERYLDDNKKFLFETYQVENSKQVLSAIRDNGGIRIEFYNEKTIYNQLYNTGTYVVNNPTFNISPNTYTYFSSGLSGSTGATGICSAIGNSVSTNYFSTIGESGFVFGTVTTATTTNPVLNDATIETGRIEKGSTSSQAFTNYYGDFNDVSSSFIEYKLLPESQKPIEVKDIRQYCPSCRNRIKKSSWKFCPACGEVLD